VIASPDRFRIRGTGEEIAMHARIFAHACIFTGACLAAVAFTAPVRAEELKAEVIHWWTSGGESAAVRVFAEQFDKAGGVWVDTAIAGGPNARAAAINRTVGGDPPAAMQFNTGKQFDELVENDMLRNVDDVAAAQHWSTIMPAAILQAVTRDGHAYAVPVNIHGQNWVFWSNAALAKAGASPPTNWTDLFVTLDKLKAAGLVPLALGDQKNWERGLFNAVLVGVGGADLFENFWGKRDVAAAKSPAFRNVAETFRRLKGYTDAAAPGRNWNDATTMVIQGKAGMQFMGDWAKGEFTAAGQTAGKEYGCSVLSNSGTGYVMGGDVFAFPRSKNPETVKAQTLLATTMLEPATQIAFAQKKGSIPSRLDLDVSALDACARKAVGWLADKSAQVPANELLAPPALTGAMEDVISSYWNDNSMTTDAFVAKVAATLAQPI
jgi:glucose/mannose transport system substrate-binding protein